MSALTHSPGFFDFLQPLARSGGSLLGAIGTLASAASFIPGMAQFARPVAAIAQALGGADVPAALVDAPSMSIVSTLPQVELTAISEEEEEDQEGEEILAEVRARHGF